MASFLLYKVGMASRPHTVNLTSRLALLVRHLFTVAIVFAAANTAMADRVVILPASGDVPLEARDDIEDAMGEALRSLSHSVLTERMAGSQGAVPETANEMRGIAEMQNADWVVVAILHDHGDEAYWITLRVGYAPATRVEELDAEVRRSNEAERLASLLQAMIRPEGLSEDGFALAGEDRTARDAEAAARTQAEADARAAEEEAARLAAEEEARRAEEEAERAREEAEEAARQAEREAQEAADAEAAFENRDRYGVADGLTLIQAGLGFRPLIKTGRDETGLLGTFEIRVGRGFTSVPGLELRGGLDFVFGAAGGLTFQVGAAYMFSPFTAPLHFGAAVEVGGFQTFTGGRNFGALVRATALVSYNITGSLYVEGSLPEFMWVSNSGGAIALGVSARLGIRL